MPTTRDINRYEWLTKTLSHSNFTITSLAGDASFRCYFRVHQNQQTYVLMDAPPDKEGLTSFLDIANRLAKQGVYTPQIHAVDAIQGFMLLEDLGDALLLKELNQYTADTLYTKALETLFAVQTTPSSDLPIFDKNFMLSELAIFREWFLIKFLNLKPTQQHSILLEQTFDWLSTQISLQPQVFIHRDYHCRNLIVTKGKLSVIDFQDAMQGPFTYDLVSLLKDCYIQWPYEAILRWITYFHTRIAHTFNISLADYIHAFDLCGLQRHLKVLGVFCRLHLRDNKSAYLNDLPLTFHYTMSCLERHQELQPFYQFMQQVIQPLFLEACNR